MAQANPKFLWDNELGASTAVLSASSTADGRSIYWIVDQLRSKRWRSATGWTIEAGFNDDIDFTEATTGDATATITAATYTTGALLAQAIEDAMNSAATDNTYSVSYSSSTGFTIARATGTTAWGLEWSTGANTATSMGEDLGFDVSADDTGATQYTADTVSYQSRHWIKVDLGAATDYDTIALVDTNLTSGGTITRQANATDAWSSPSVSATTWDSSVGDPILIKYIGSTETYRWLRVLIDDTANSDGYVEIGVWVAGEEVEFTTGYMQGFARGRKDLSRVTISDQGAHFVDLKQQGVNRVITLPLLTDAQLATLETMFDAMNVGESFIASFDPSNDIAETYWMHLDGEQPQPLHVGRATADAWTVTLPLTESLG